MKGKLWVAGLVVFCGTVAYAGTETNSPVVRVGIYDSRAIAYAYFASGSFQANLKEAAANAKDAQKSGDTNRLIAMTAILREQQADLHRQVFSVAPVTNALVVIRNRLPGIEQHAGVTGLVSKWDEPTLQKYKNAEQVDVTDELVREFINPTEAQKKTIESIEASQPMPLEKCNELIREGKI